LTTYDNRKKKLREPLQNWNKGTTKHPKPNK